MKTFIRIVVLLLLVGGWGLAASSLHLVRTQKDRVLLIPKQRLSLSETYVDARNWTLADVANHPAVVQRIIESGKAGEFAFIVGADHGDVAAVLAGAIEAGPASAAPVAPNTPAAVKSPTKAEAKSSNTHGPAVTAKPVHGPIGFGI